MEQENYVRSENFRPIEGKSSIVDDLNRIEFIF